MLPYRPFITLTICAMSISDRSRQQTCGESHHRALQLYSDASSIRVLDRGPRPCRHVLNTPMQTRQDAFYSLSRIPFETLQHETYDS